MRLVLPYPPSTNHYYRHTRQGTKISEEGRDYHALIKRVVAGQLAASGEAIQPFAGRLAVRIKTHQPDNRRRDLDNLQKPLLDALSRGVVYQDDSQIDWLLTERGQTLPKSARVIVDLFEKIPAHRCPLCNHELN